MLLGCDYLDPVRGVGPKKALKLIQEHKTLEAVLEHLQQQSDLKKAGEDTKRKSQDSDDEDKAAPKKRAGGIQVPDVWPFEEARKLFQEPQVQDGSTVQARKALTHVPVKMGAT